MTTESIQNRTLSAFDALDEARRDRWSHIGETLGLPLTVDQLDELRSLSDREAAGRFFPQLLDVEVDELLWAANVDDEVRCGACAA
jgi:hypothetical protein